jgi:hypothetical protein
MSVALRSLPSAGREIDAAWLKPVRRSNAKWRDALLSGVAAGALSLGIGGPALAAPDACTINGTVAICVGNQSAGISSGVDFTDPPVTTLDVDNLTQAITPASGTQGIKFLSTVLGGAVTINSNTGSFGISATNALQAIDAIADGAVTVTSTGNITTTTMGPSGGIGIYARSTGDNPVTVTSSGNITTSTAGSGANGIFAYGLGGGVVTVTSTGNISTTGGSSNGIYAKSHGGGAGDTVTLSSTGNISTTGAGSDGILASSDGAVTVATPPDWIIIIRPTPCWAFRWPAAAPTGIWRKGSAPGGAMRFSLVCVA